MKIEEIIPKCKSQPKVSEGRIIQQYGSFGKEEWGIRDQLFSLGGTYVE